MGGSGRVGPQGWRLGVLPKQPARAARPRACPPSPLTPWPCLTSPCPPSNVDFSGEPLLQNKTTPPGSRPEPLVKRYVVKNVGGYKVALLGWLTADTATTASNAGAVKFRDVDTSVKKCVADIKREVPDVHMIIGLSHNGEGRSAAGAGRFGRRPTTASRLGASARCTPTRAPVPSQVGACNRRPAPALPHAPRRTWSLPHACVPAWWAHACASRLALQPACLTPPAHASLAPGYLEDLVTAAAVPDLDIIIGGECHGATERRLMGDAAGATACTCGANLHQVMLCAGAPCLLPDPAPSRCTHLSARSRPGHSHTLLWPPSSTPALYGKHSPGLNGEWQLSWSISDAIIQRRREADCLCPKPPLSSFPSAALRHLKPLLTSRERPPPVPPCLPQPPTARPSAPATRRRGATRPL